MLPFAVQIFDFQIIFAYVDLSNQSFLFFLGQPYFPKRCPTDLVIRCISIKLFVEFSYNFSSLLSLKSSLSSFFFILNVFSLFFLITRTEDLFFCFINQLYTACFVFRFVNFYFMFFPTLF